MGNIRWKIGWGLQCKSCQYDSKIYTDSKIFFFWNKIIIIKIQEKSPNFLIFFFKWVFSSSSSLKTRNNDKLKKKKNKIKGKISLTLTSLVRHRSILQDWWFRFERSLDMNIIFFFKKKNKKSDHLRFNKLDRDCESLTSDLILTYP